MKKTILFLVTIFLACDKQPCPDLKFIDGITYDSNGKPYTGNCSTFYNDFNIKSIEKYNKGKDHGKWTFYFNNGNVQTQGRFEDGLKTGEWKYFYETGEIWKLNYFSKGKKIKNWSTFDLNGNKIDSINFN